MAGQSLRVPHRRFWGETMSSPLSTLRTSRERLDGTLDRQGWTGRRVLGMKIPDWQRGDVWTGEQEVRFIESLYLGASIGQYMLNEHQDDGLSGFVLDGQQRLLAIERYWEGRFGIPGEDGRTWFWTDLDPATEHPHLLRIQFPYLLTRYGSEAQMQDAYNRHNAGGTPHGPEDLAQGAEDLSLAPKGMLPR